MENYLDSQNYGEAYEVYAAVERLKELKYLDAMSGTRSSCSTALQRSR